MHASLKLIALLLTLCSLLQAVEAQEAEEVLDLAELERQLEARIVTDDDFARGLLFSWTSREQADALRRDRKILVATASSGDGPTPFNRALRTVAKRKDKHGSVARALLERDPLKRRRYAWTSPFGTAKARGKRSYGRYLIQISLRPDAWTGHFEPGQREPFRFVTSDGAPLPLEEVAAHPESIAAIYHTRVPPAVRDGFREYVLCNEAMIESWSLGTEEIAQRVADEATLLRSLVRTLTSERPWAKAYRLWSTRKGLEGADLEDRYRATLAFDIRHYRIRPARLRAIAEALADYAVVGAGIKEEMPLPAIREKGQGAR